MENTITQVTSLDAKQYIVVKLGNEQFGIDIQYVENIVRIQRITRVPKVQNFFKGVINLRGDIVPVMSLRLKFGLEGEDYTNSTRVIILKPEGKEVLGIVVDEVKEVVALTDAIEVSDTTSAEDKYIKAIVTYGDETYLVLNIPEILDLQFAI